MGPSINNLHHVGLCRLIIMSADLCWQIVRNNHAYLMKRQNIKKPFSSEPNNLKNVNSAKFNGFCRQRVVGISEAEDKNGIVFTYKTVKNQNKPGKQIKKTTIRGGNRKVLGSVRNIIKHNNYRGDLKQAALRRTSANSAISAGQALQEVPQAEEICGQEDRSCSQEV